jgi:hypothetical protein
MQMEALQQQWDNTSSALEALQQEDKRCKKHIGRLQQQTEVGAVMSRSMAPCARHAACRWGRDTIRDCMQQS